MKALVIIDMQNKYLNDDAISFLDNNSKRNIRRQKLRAISKITKKINEYKRNNNFIVLVSFLGFGETDIHRTNATIWKAIGNYPYLLSVMKMNCDGGREIFNAIRAMGITIDEYEFCGAYTSACVEHTAKTLGTLVDTKSRVSVLLDHTVDTYTLDVEKYKKRLLPYVKVV